LEEDDAADDELDEDLEEEVAADDELDEDLEEDDTTDDELDEDLLEDDEDAEYACSARAKDIVSMKTERKYRKITDLFRK